MHAVILSGGVGSRLWPISRERHPKPFIRMLDNQSFLQKAFLRLAAIPEIQSITTVINQELLFKTQDDYAEIQHLVTRPIDTHVILEPFGRNTAAAIAAATLYISKLYNHDALLLVTPADHLIRKQDAFHHAVMQAVTLAQAGNIVTFGIQPDAPEPGYGYIEACGHNVLRFIEKPSLEQAQGYLLAKNFLWNSGMFCFTADTMLREMELHCPEILSTTASCFAQSHFSEHESTSQLELNPEHFAHVPENSIDYAVMEQSKHIAVIPCDIGWCDVGTWNALSNLTEPDSQGNRIPDGFCHSLREGSPADPTAPYNKNHVLLENVSNCYIQSHSRVIAVADVENLVIVDTPDALLVTNKQSTQGIQKLYSKLKQQDNDIHKQHRWVHRPWGSYTTLEEGPGFKIKRIEINPGARLSLQMHFHRCEHWVVVSGTAKVTNHEREFLLEVNESTYISATHKHRLENPGTEPLVIVEVQTGDYLGEDDIVRFDDAYGRVSKTPSAESF